MKKRIGYVGLSYPLLYDYKNPASKCRNDVSSSPNPIIDSPMGLMIFYDELWFLCRSICPENMRNLPYVKFVDEMFDYISFVNFGEFKENISFNKSHDRMYGYSDMIRKMNIDYRGVDGHTHGLKICDFSTSANGGYDNYIFDLYVMTILNNILSEDIEMISNSMYRIGDYETDSTYSELTERILIHGIPNYLSVKGPYHECIEVLRENKYLKDFRKWIIENHSHHQASEIDDVCRDVELNIQQTQKDVFKKYLEDNDSFSCFFSTGKTLVSTIEGFFFPMISVIDAAFSINAKAKNTKAVSFKRWQGFVIDARDTLKLNELSR